MFLIKNTSVVFQQRFLRASGGVSLLSARLLRMAWFSPRKRRCFYHSVLAMCSVYVFSAQAEVFLILGIMGTPGACFLRASGGVSIRHLYTSLCYGFSPRKRRCFYERSPSSAFADVFSAQAEVFPLSRVIRRFSRCFLRASGGVSKVYSAIRVSLEFSPRKRRCFYPRRVLGLHQVVFSAQAEVFLYSTDIVAFIYSFLRASGGVSEKGLDKVANAVFSPRKRRCFHLWIR